MKPIARRILFRLELGGATGWGHLARCAALAEEMQARGWSCYLWTDSDARDAPDDLRAPFSDVIPAGPEWSRRCPDAEAVVVDWYDATDDALHEVRAATPKTVLLVIDDEARRTLAAADLVLNSRLGLTQSPYAPATRALLGESYVLLRAGIRAPRAVASPFPPEVAPILVTMGGTDPRGLTAQVIHAIADVDARAYAPVVVARREGQEFLQPALTRFAAHQWLERVDAVTFAGWAGICRGAVSACGGTLYELAAIGVPFIGVVVAENQRALAAEVARRWGLPVIEVAENVRAGVAAALPQLRAGLHGSGLACDVDGRGAARVADAIEQHLTTG